MREEASALMGGGQTGKRMLTSPKNLPLTWAVQLASKASVGKQRPLPEDPLTPYLRDDEEHPKRLRLTRFAQTKRDKRARAGAEKEGLPRTLRRQIGDAKEFS